MLEFWKKSRKLLGMNARNLSFIRPYNRKSGFRLADDKILSKRVMKKNGIAVPALLAKIKNHDDLENFDWQTLASSFALKPNHGFGGEGILVVYAKSKKHPDTWIKADGSLVSVEDLKSHIRNILDGTYSLSNRPDTAFFEERLQLLKLFKPYAHRGIPDIRVIVFNKVPVMAMLRLPTKHSGGKANLQQGAVGVGIDLATGTTTTAVWQKSKIIEYLPDTRLLLSGIKIPYWNDILKLAVRSQEVSGLGFLGADVAIDKERGPVLLELNARPGLSIQIANLSGLKERLERVAGLNIKTLEKGVRVGMDLFGGEIEEELEEISGRKIIGPVEKIKLIGKDGLEVQIEAKIDTGAGFSSIDLELARQLGFGHTLEAYEKIGVGYDDIKEWTQEKREELFRGIPDLADTAIIHSATGSTYRPMIKIALVIDGKEIPAKVTVIDRAHLDYPVIVGKRHLGRFLIDVNKPLSLKK